MTNSTQLSDCVVDTMAFILHLEKRKLTPWVKSIFKAAESGNITIFVPGIVMAEILYLSERKRIGLSLQDVAKYLPHFPNFREYPLDLRIVRAASEITDVKELHDRLIAATGRALNIPVMTNDPMIQSSAFVQTIW